MDQHPDLLAHFNAYFEILRADTPVLLEDAFRLRYQVYCVQGTVPGFDPRDYPDGLERDVYDGNAVHCLLRHRPSGSYAGVVRLMLADPAQPCAPFPIEVAADDRIDREYLQTLAGCRDRVAEVSRLILAERFRMRRGEQQFPDGLAEVSDRDRGMREQRVLPHPILGLIKAAMTMAWEHDIDHVLTAMEPRLDRRLRQFGVTLKPVSPFIDYHGPVRAHWGYLPDLFARAREHHPEVWALVSDNGAIWPPAGSTVSLPARRRQAGRKENHPA